MNGGAHNAGFITYVAILYDVFIIAFSLLWGFVLVKFVKAMPSMNSI